MSSAEPTPRQQAVKQILYMWEDTAVEVRLTIPEMEQAAEAAIDALRSVGWTRV